MRLSGWDYVDLFLVILSNSFWVLAFESSLLEEWSIFKICNWREIVANGWQNMLLVCNGGGCNDSNPEASDFLFDGLLCAKYV